MTRKIRHCRNCAKPFLASKLRNKLCYKCHIIELEKEKRKKLNYRLVIPSFK